MGLKLFCSKIVKTEFKIEDKQLIKELGLEFTKLFRCIILSLKTNILQVNH